MPAMRAISCRQGQWIPGLFHSPHRVPTSPSMARWSGLKFKSNAANGRNSCPATRAHQQHHRDGQFERNQGWSPAAARLCRRHCGHYRRGFMQVRTVHARNRREREQRLRRQNPARQHAKPSTREFSEGPCRKGRRSMTSLETIDQAECEPIP